MLGVNGQSAGSNVYAIIESSVGAVYLPASSSFGPYTTQALAALVLAEVSPTRFRAAVPSLAAGRYGVSYFLRGSATPASTDRVLGAEDLTIGDNSTVSISVLPVTVEAVGPKIDQGNIRVYSRTADVILFRDIRDGSGTAVDLTGKQLRFVVDDCRGRVLFQVDSGITFSGGTVKVPLTVSQTAKPVDATYALRNMTDNTVIATGDFSVTDAPLGL